MIKVEAWATIKEFPGWKVSTMGRIMNARTGYILKQQVDKDGYLKVSLGNTDNLSVHRLVAKAFCSCPDNDFDNWQVNHIDNNRQNNHCDNLEWVSGWQNFMWAYNQGRINWQKGLEAASKVNGRKVIILETGDIFRTVKDCADFLRATPQSIQRVLSGERKGQHVHGYTIKYLEDVQNEGEFNR